MPIASPCDSPEVEETIHGVTVADPFRWLETRSTPETEGWIRGQNRLCDEYFAEFDRLETIRTRVRSYLDVEVADQPAKIGERYFYRLRKPGEEQASLYVRDGEAGTARRLVDPSALGPFASVGIHRISIDGRLLAYDLRHGGRDQKSIHIVDVDTGRLLEDDIPSGIARGFAFASDSRGFYYCHERESACDHLIYFHRLGDLGPNHVCFSRPRTEGSRLVFVSDQQRVGAIHIRQSGSSQLLDLWTTTTRESTSWKLVLSDRPMPFLPILKLGRIYAVTYEHAPNGRLVELDGTGAEMRTIIPERDGTISQIVFVHNLIFLNRIHATETLLECWSLEGGHLNCLDGSRGKTFHLIPNQCDGSDTLFYVRESYSELPTIFEYPLSSGVARLWHKRFTPGAWVPLAVRKMHYSSTDGTSIPLTLVAEEQSACKQITPTILSCYGGFGIGATPQFSILVTILTELGLTFALPCIRGGGEFGKAWHDAARGRNRQVAFDDFIAAAEWLCRNGIAMPDRLAILGGSNAGLLAGAVMTQRPDLFRAVVCIAPLLDMVRFEILGASAKWRGEYGSVEDPQDFQALYAYSPYHRVDDNTNYPSVLFVSGDSDQRCNPAHVRKMAARLQGRRAQQRPIVVDYSEERGHAPTLPLTTRIDALTRRIAFLCRELGVGVDFGGLE